MILLHDLVLIKEIKQLKETVSDSGLIIPTKAKEKEYEVLQIGQKCKGIKVGDKLRLYEHADKVALNDGFLINESKGIKVIL